MQQQEFRAMNTEIMLLAEGDEVRVQLALENVRRFIHASEARFTRFSETSELAQLNRAAGQWFFASVELVDLLGQARDFAQQTAGLFDPTLLDALEAVGYDRSLELVQVQGARPPVATPTLPPSLNRLAAMELDAATRAVRLPPGVRLDLGGIAKGWIVERAAHLLAQETTACAVNAGGDLFTVGLPQGTNAWPIALEDPRDSQQTLAILHMGPGAMATSSVTRRCWQQAGRSQHHLIDPRTGLPATSEWLSATVVAPHATTAEVFAKVLLIGGKQALATVTAHQADLTFIVVDQAGQLWGSSHARELLDVD